MSAQFILPKQYVCDQNGEPLMGAKANFYIISTSTRKNTYIDAALSEAHANPVIADAYGVFPSIWLDESGTDYRVVVTDQFDVQQYAIDGLLSESTPTDLLDAIKTVDGAGSGLDADTLDGLNSTAFTQKAEDESISGLWNFTGANPMVGGQAIGYRDVPTVFASGQVELNLTHRGWCISNTSGGILIPVLSGLTGYEGQFPHGSIILFENDSTANQQIVAETPATTTIRLAGTLTTGTRTVAPYGVAVMFQPHFNEWLVYGVGVS